MSCRSKLGPVGLCRASPGEGEWPVGHGQSVVTWGPRVFWGFWASIWERVKPKSGVASLELLLDPGESRVVV